MTTTDNIRLNHNDGFNLKKTKSGELEWSLLYDSSAALDDAFFKTLTPVEIANMMMFMGDRMSMWDGFTHMKDRYTKIKKPAVLAINACLLSEAIRTARNRTEAYHQLQGMIRITYSGIFKGNKIIDNRVSAHATRLIANCIIAYNSIILNDIYEQMLRDGVDQKVIQEFARISPIAWAHILFTGRYNFQKSSGDIDIAEMVQEMVRHLRQYFWKAAT